MHEDYVLGHANLSLWITEVPLCTNSEVVKFSDYTEFNFTFSTRNTIAKIDVLYYRAQIM